jgi:hypothetical protein
MKFELKKGVRFDSLKDGDVFSLDNYNVPLMKVPKDSMFCGKDAARPSGPVRAIWIYNGSPCAHIILDDYIVYAISGKFVED